MTSSGFIDLVRVLGVGLAASLSAAPTVAQVAPVGAASPVPAPVAVQEAPSDPDEIVVTAQRVQENLQDVPLAVSAFSADRLEQSNIETVADIALRTPGFTATAVDPIQPNYAVRGIGSAQGISQNAGGDPSVVVFVDGVYQGRGGTPDIDALDLERIEVLRGPQGTLFGKNAIGGLIQFVTRRPSADDSLRLEGWVGNYDRISLNARGNVALADNLFLSAGFSSKQRDGFEFNETTGNRVNDEKLSTARGALRFVASDALEFLLSVDIARQDQKGNPRHNICDASFNGGIHCVGVNPDPRVVNAYIDGRIERDLETYRGEINWTTPIGELTSVTALRKSDLGNTTPFFSNPINPPAQIESTEIGDEDNEQFSQELRLAFGLFDERLEGQVGVYYLKEDNNRVQDLIQDFAAPAISGRARYPQEVDGRSVALFGQFGYHVTDALTATLGARMTWEKKSGRFAGFVVRGATPTSLPPPLAQPYDVEASETWKAFTPRGALDWKVSDDVLLYASATRGYKSGGFQGIAGSAAGARTPYDPEFAWSYEVGAKTQWLDGAVRLNLSLFHTDYKDLQISTLVPLCCVVVSNAGTATIEGAELEAVVRPVEGLQLDGSYAYLDAEFEEFGVNSGNRIPRSPKGKINLGGQYGMALGGGWGARARIDYTHQSKSFFDASNALNQTQRAFSNLDARIGVTGPDERWEIALFGKNLTNELVPTYVTAFNPYRQVLVPYAPPRTYGLQLIVRM